MYHFLSKKPTIKPEFPERVDLSYLTDREAGAAHHRPCLRRDDARGTG